MDLSQELLNTANSERAKISQRFFKTGKGQYGEGDVFLGIDVPTAREISKKYIDLKLPDLKKHLNSKYHEERLVALLILVEKYKKEKEEVVKFYLSNTEKINNWDLVDSSADKIIGEYFYDKNNAILNKLAKSDNLWERRIAIVSTFAFIKKKSFSKTFEIVEILLEDKHDLIQKACGWMLREIGKRDENELENYLNKRYRNMPRTMLRYSIERLGNKRLKYLNGEI